MSLFQAIWSLNLVFEGQFDSFCGANRTQNLKRR